LIVRVANHNICDEKRERLTGKALCAGIGDPLCEIKRKTSSSAGAGARRETPNTYSTYKLNKFSIKLIDMAIYIYIYIYVKYAIYTTLSSF
jgi:hypothetical protein